MLLALITWHNPFATPPESLRILYLLALLGPLTIKKPQLFALIIPTFYTVSNYSCFISYMPNQVFLYLAFPIVALFIHKCNNVMNKPALVLLFFFILTVVMNFAGSMAFESVSACCLLTILWYKFTPCQVESYTHLFSFAFALMSLILSILFIFAGSTFQQNFGASGFDRTEWMDPNYFGCAIGIGIVTSMIEVLYNEKLIKNGRIFYLGAIGLSFFVLIMNASRGALLASCAALLLLLMGNRKNLKKKLVVVCCITLFVYALYLNGVFDFLLYRIELDSGNGGSGRTYIWQEKLNVYNNQLSLMEQVFGIGYKKGMHLAFGYARGFHNDYIAILVEYGILGILLFSSLLISPIVKSFNKTIVTSVLLYIAFVCSTLEPISGGMIVYFGFFFYACLVGKCKYFTQTRALN